MCKTFDDNINASEFLLDSYKIQNLSNKAAHNYAHALRYVTDQNKSTEIYDYF